MRATWYMVVTCDGCGQATKVDAWSSDQSTAWKQPGPAGWYGSDAMSWQLRDSFGLVIQDICPGCLKLPFEQLIGQIMKTSEKRANGDGD